MKTKLTLTIVFVCGLTFAHAQTADYNNAITLQVGLSSAHSFAANDIHGSLTDDEQKILTRGESSPAVFLNWDYGFWESHLSINAGLAYNKSTVYYDDTNAGMPGRTDGAYYDDATGVTFGTRLLGHLLNGPGSKLDVYFGAGVYIGVWTYTRSNGGPNFVYTEADHAQLATPLFVGGRFLFTERLAATAEFSTFTNSRLSLGLAVLFGAD